jgi:putative Mn2+ efflux pump MntP
MDVLSVAAATGFGMGRMTGRQMTRLAASFGAFHIFMPVLGWAAGTTFVDLISGYDHWAAFLLLAFVGGRMLLEAARGCEDVDPARILQNSSLLLFSVAVSVDSVAVGLSFSLEKTPILVPALVMGATAFAFTYLGVVLSSRVGGWLGRWSQVIGGLILIGIGIRVLLTHVM